MGRSSHKTLSGFLKRPRSFLSTSVLALFVFITLFATFLSPFDPSQMDLVNRLSAPGFPHILGCDLNGADVFSSMLHGGQASLYIALCTVALSMSFGIGIGMISGYYGGVIDLILMRLVDIVMAIPGILVAMVLSTLLGPSLNNIIIAISATGWTSSARLCRGQVLSAKERDFVTATKLLGASPLRLMQKHIWPQIITPMVVQATFALSSVIIIESSLSFLGLGAQDGSPTWGALLGQGRTVIEEAPHLTIIPGLAIMVVVMALNFLGDDLRDYLDPKG